MGRLTKEEQIENIDTFTAELIMAIMSEGLSMGINQDQQMQAQEAIRALGEAAKSIIGKVPPTMFASAMVTYGQALMESMVSGATEEAKDGGRQVFQHMDEKISTKTGNEEDDE